MDIIKARQELMQGKSIYDMNLKVVDYGRVSTDKDDQLNSLENQINYFNDMIGNVKNWIHVCSYTDEGISGTQVYKREEFLKMMESARLGKIDLIVTKEVSRFARNTIDSLKYTQLLLEYGVAVYFISDNIITLNPDSEMRLSIMASLAQDEVRKLSERVKFGVKRSIKDRKLGGGGLYGYNKKDCKLTIIDTEAEAIKMLYNLYVTEEFGFKRIGEKLAEKGYYTRNGKVFSDTTLKKMLQNPRYKGYYTANLSEIENYKTHKKVAKPQSEWIIEKDEKGNVPAIVSEELWDRCNAIYRKRTEAINKNNLNKEVNIQNKKYTSKLFCAEHNTTFIRCANGKRKENPVWECNEYMRHGIKGCETPILYEKHLNEIFTSVLESFIQNKDKLLNDIVRDYINLIKESNEGIDIEKIKLKIKEQENFKDRLFDMSLRKLIDDNDFVERNNKISENINKLKKEICTIENNRESPEYYKEIANKIRKLITPKLNIKENIGKYFNLFIDKVFVSKINNNRKHVKLQMIFNFKKEDELIEANFETEEYNKILTINANNRDYSVRASFANNFFRQKYLLLNSEEPWFCRNGPEVRKRKII